MGCTQTLTSAGPVAHMGIRSIFSSAPEGQPPSYRGSQGFSKAAGAEAGVGETSPVSFHITVGHPPVTHPHEPRLVLPGLAACLWVKGKVRECSHQGRWPRSCGLDKGYISPSDGSGQRGHDERARLARQWEGLFRKPAPPTRGHSHRWPITLFEPRQGACPQ